MHGAGLRRDKISSHELISQKLSEHSSENPEMMAWPPAKAGFQTLIPRHIRWSSTAGETFAFGLLFGLLLLQLHLFSNSKNAHHSYIQSGSDRWLVSSARRGPDLSAIGDVPYTRLRLPT